MLHQAPRGHHTAGRFFCPRGIAKLSNVSADVFLPVGSALVSLEFGITARRRCAPEGHHKLAGGVSHRTFHQIKPKPRRGAGRDELVFVTPAGVGDRSGLVPVAYATG